MRRLDGRMVRRWAAALGAAALAALCITLATGRPGTAEAQGAPVSVNIVDFAFNPASVTVPVGGRVTWTNTGQAPHTSTSQAGGWDSGRLAPGGTFSFTAAQAGSFAYACLIHPNMQGTVVVQAAAGQAAPAAAPAAGGQAAPALPRTGTGLVADNEAALPAVLLAVTLVVGAGALAYRRRRA
jgi:plastocyanin